MTPHAVADLLERFATEVLELPGVSRTRPHAFVEAKSELRGEIMRKAAELRTGLVPPKSPLISLPALRPGSIQVGRRVVAVEVRGRRRV